MRLWLLMVYFSTLRFLLIGYALWSLATLTRHHALTAINLACKFGFLGETFVCRFAGSTASPYRYADAIQTEFSGLERLASGATQITPLVQSLTEARLSVDDLVVVVRLSTFSFRASLVEELLVVSSETREASRNLQKLFAEIQAAVDMYVSTLVPK